MAQRHVTGTSWGLLSHGNIHQYPQGYFQGQGALINPPVYPTLAQGDFYAGLVPANTTNASFINTSQSRNYPHTPSPPWPPQPQIYSHTPTQVSPQSYALLASGIHQRLPHYGSSPTPAANAGATPISVNSTSPGLPRTPANSNDFTQLQALDHHRASRIVSSGSRTSSGPHSVANAVRTRGKIPGQGASSPRGQQPSSPPSSTVLRYTKRARELRELADTLKLSDIEDAATAMANAIDGAKH